MSKKRQEKPLKKKKKCVSYQDPKTASHASHRTQDTTTEIHPDSLVFYFIAYCGDKTKLLPFHLLTEKLNEVRKEILTSLRRLLGQLVTHLLVF